LAGLGLGHRRNVVFVAGLFGVDPGVVDVHVDVVFAQLVHDVHHPRIAQVGAVFLEGQAHEQHARALHVDALLGHALHQLRHHVAAHGVVQAAARQDDLGVIANGLRLVGQVVGIDANAVPAHQAGTERQEVQLGAGGLQHGFGIDAHLVEDQGQLIDERDVHVALRVLDDLGGLGHADARGLVGAGRDDLVIQRIAQVGDFGRRARGDLLDGIDAVRLVARIDALGAVAGVEIFVELQARIALEHRHAVFFSGARIHGGLVDDDVAALEHRADSLAGLDQRRQVGLLVVVDGRGHGHDVHVGLGQFGAVGGVGQVPGFGQLRVVDLQRVVMPRLQGVDALDVDVETDHRTLLAELYGQWQPDITESDHGKFYLIDTQDSSPFAALNSRHLK